MKPQNFYAFLDNYSICGESILSRCQEIKTLHEGLVEYFEEGEKTSKRLKTNMKLFGAKSREELKKKKTEEVTEEKRDIENISKFISFLEEEGEKHLEILQTEEFADWVDELNGETDDDFFEPIDCISAYIQKHSGVLVRDLLQTFQYIMNIIAIEIEEVIGAEFPPQGNTSYTLLVQNIIQKKGIKLTKKGIQNMADNILTYEDFEELSAVIEEDIKELEEPVKR